MLALSFPALVGMGDALRAQGNCPNCDLPPGCRGNGNQNGNGNGNRDRNCQRIAITIESDVDFGRLVLLGAGGARVLLDLNSGQKTVFGEIDDLGGMPITGRALVTGAPFEVRCGDLPLRPIWLVTRRRNDDQPSKRTTSTGSSKSMVIR